MKIILVLALVTVACANELSDLQCAWGESHWCSSIKAAKSCGAIQHCMTTVWLHQALPVDRSEECQFCQSIVNDVRNMLTDKQTQAEIQTFLDSACAIIPDKDMATECKNLVDTSLSEILDMISSELDPNVVCAAMGLCQGFRDQAMHPRSHNLLFMPRIKVPKEMAEPVCTDCKKFMGDIKAMIESKATESQIEQMLEQQLCAQLGSFEAECKTLVELYIPEIMQMASSQFDPAQICQMLGFCTATKDTPKCMLAKLRLLKSPLYIAAMKASEAAYCEVCKTIAGEVQTLDRDKAVQDEVKSFLKNDICSKLGSLKDACDSSVDMYAPELFELIAEELDPSTLCLSLGFCSGNSIRPVSAARQATPETKPVTVQASSKCILCELVMRELDSMLENNATEQEIMAALDKVCSVLPKTVATECKDFVDTYGPAVIAMLSQELDPQTVCTMLGLCSQSHPEVMALKLEGSELCGICETLIQYVDSILEQNATIKEIEDLLDRICNFLPSTMKQECDNIIAQYGPAIAQLIAQFADPREICTEIGLCKNSKQVKMETIVPAKAALVGTNECSWGPAYWCASDENARKCGAEEHCKRVAAKQQPVQEEVIRPAKAQLVGTNECTYGPAYWCASKENAVKCGTVEHCTKHVWGQ